MVLYDVVLHGRSSTDTIQCTQKQCKDGHLCMKPGMAVSF